MQQYITRFTKMVKELESMSYIEVLNFSLFEPASLDDLAKIEESIGCTLSSSIKSFYTISNGLQLKWIHKNNPKYSSEEHYYRESQFDFLEPMEWYGAEDGCVNILPIEMIFIEQDWNEIIWFYEDEDYSLIFNKELYNRLEFMQRIKPLDIFSKNKSMAFLIEENIIEPKVLLLQEHFVDAESSRLTNFNSYLEFVLHHYGLISKRTNFYNAHDGHEMSTMMTPQEYWKNQSRPNLQTLYT